MTPPGPEESSRDLQSPPQTQAEAPTHSCCFPKVNFPQLASSSDGCVKVRSSSEQMKQKSSGVNEPSGATPPLLHQDPCSTGHSPSAQSDSLNTLTFTSLQPPRDLCLDLGSSRSRAGSSGRGCLLHLHRCFWCSSVIRALTCSFFLLQVLTHSLHTTEYRSFRPADKNRL